MPSRGLWYWARLSALQEVCVLRPTLQLDTEAYGMRRWFQPFVPQPWSKGSRRTARLALVDAVHHLLQTSHDGFAQGVVAHGEACLVVLAALSSDFRLASYAARHFSPATAETMEATAASWRHAVLIAPHGFPPRLYMPYFRDYAPELSCVVAHAGTQVLVVIPEHDHLRDHSREVANALPQATRVLHQFRAARIQNFASRPLFGGPWSVPSKGFSCCFWGGLS